MGAEELLTQSYFEDSLEAMLAQPVQSVRLREQATFRELAAPFGDSIVLFGAGSLGRKALSGLRRLGIQPLAFTDSNPALWGTSIDRLEVLPPEDAASEFGHRATFVVTIWSPGNGFSETRGRLTNLGCPRVVSFVPLFNMHPTVFLPHVCVDLPHRIIDAADAVKAAASLLADDSSRKEYLAQLRWLLDPVDMGAGLFESSPGSKDTPEDLFATLPNEVFVDCGAFDGDSVRQFLRKSGGAFGKIVALEPDPTNFRKLENYVRALPTDIKGRIILRQVAVGLRREKLAFQPLGTVGSALSSSGEIMVDVVPLDDFLVGAVAPTLVKMDIEGAELDALAGGQRAIRTSSPLLSICVYHRQDHLWRIPLTIRSLSSDYRIFLRRHSSEFWDLVCYGVPLSRLTSNGE